MALQAATKETRHLFSNAFTLIAHGINVRRASIVGTDDLKLVLDPPGKIIEFDLEEQYERMIKDIYSANIEFLARAQAAAGHEFSGNYSALRKANMDVVAAIKAVKHLRKNLLQYMPSDNLNIRREYNRFQIRIAEVLRSLAGIRETEDRVITLLSLDMIRVEVLDSENEAASIADKLIRESAITSQMATSLISDGAYVKEIIQRLLDMNEQLHRAELSHDDMIQDELALKAEEIANIAKYAGTIR